MRVPTSVLHWSNRPKLPLAYLYFRKHLFDRRSYSTSPLTGPAAVRQHRRAHEIAQNPHGRFAHWANAEFLGLPLALNVLEHTGIRIRSNARAH